MVARSPSSSTTCNGATRPRCNCSSRWCCRGRCRACGVRFSARAVLIEAGTALLILGAYHLTVAVFHVGDSPEKRLLRFGVYALFLLVLVIISFIDLDTKLIPDRITYPAIPAFYLLGWALGDRSLLDRLIGIVVGYGVVLLILVAILSLIFRRRRPALA